MAALPTVFLAAGMRTGSTHIKNCFVRLGFRPASTHITLEDNVNEEHMVDARNATILFPMGGFVFQQHVRAIGRNVPLLQEFGVRPVIVHRSVLDCVVSWKESADKDYTAGRRQGSYSPTHMPDWGRLGEGDKFRWIAYNIVPWYYSFYVSWREAQVEKLFVDYDEFFKDEVEGLVRISNFLGLPFDHYSMANVAGHKTGKFNVGVSGRGKSLPEEIKHIVRKQANAWGPQWEEELCRNA